MCNYPRRVGDISPRSFKTLLNTISNQVCWLVIKSQTIVWRFWLGILSLCLAFYFLTGIVVSDSLLLKLAPPIFWAACYFLNGCGILYGIFLQKYNTYLLFIEGYLGTVIWTSTAIAMFNHPQVSTIILVGAILSFWLLVRYPSNQEFKNAN